MLISKEFYWNKNFICDTLLFATTENPTLSNYAFGFSDPFASVTGNPMSTGAESGVSMIGWRDRRGWPSKTKCWYLGTAAGHSGSMGQLALSAGWKFRFLCSKPVLANRTFHSNENVLYSTLMQ